MIETSILPRKENFPADLSLTGPRLGSVIVVAVLGLGWMNLQGLGLPQTHTCLLRLLEMFSGHPVLFPMLLIHSFIRWMTYASGSH